MVLRCVGAGVTYDKLTQLACRAKIKIIEQSPMAGVNRLVNGNTQLNSNYASDHMSLLDGWMAVQTADFGQKQQRVNATDTTRPPYGSTCMHMMGNTYSPGPADSFHVRQVVQKTVRSACNGSIPTHLHLRRYVSHAHMNQRVAMSVLDLARGQTCSLQRGVCMLMQSDWAAATTARARMVVRATAAM
jgi:hypothetical protein